MINIVEISFPTQTFQEQLTNLLSQAITSRLLKHIRHLVENEQARLIELGEGDTATPFVVLHRANGFRFTPGRDRHNGCVEIVSVKDFHKLVVNELNQHPRVLEHAEHETFMRIARGFGWLVE